MVKEAEKLIEEMKEKNSEKILDNVKDKIEKERTMKLSVKEGSYASVMSGFGDAYITPYALSLNANNLAIGFLSSFTGLISPLSQLLGSKLMEKYSRKKIITTAVTLHALMWLPILLLSLLFQKNIFQAYLPIILIVFYSVYALFGALGGPAWFSLLGDIIPEKIRGAYFGKRNKICSTVALLSTIAAAFILDFFKTRGVVLVGFSILFFFACIFRLLSANTFRKHYEPKFKLQPGYYFSFWQFIKKAPSNNFGKFVIFIALIDLSTNISAPFFSVYMLKDLNFSYITFMLVNISSSIFSILFMPVWGKFADKYGNKDLLKLGAFMIPFIPILWLFSKSPVYLAFSPQLLSGVGWAAFNLAATNYIYDCVSPQRRALCVSYYNIIAGVGVFIGAIIGGFLASYLSITFMNKLLFVFLISGILRLVVVFFALPVIKEVRQTENKKNPILYLREFRPITGVVMEIISDVRNIKDGIKKISRKKFSFDF